MSLITAHTPPLSVYSFPYTTLFRSLGDDLDDLDPPTGQSRDLVGDRRGLGPGELGPAGAQAHGASAELLGFDEVEGERERTRLNSRDVARSYAVCFLVKTRS